MYKWICGNMECYSCRNVLCRNTATPQDYGVESVPKITCLRGPPAFRRSPTFSRPHGFRVLDIPHVNALSVPKIRCLRGPPTFQRSHSFRSSDLFLRLIGCLTYN